MKMLFLPLLLLLLLGGGVMCGDVVRIASTDDLIDFSNSVNSGANYSETTVFLDADIDLSGKTFEPIGNASNYFLGTFDGQGHTISNLEINSQSAQYVGLFGFSYGASIRNVVMDSSCSVTSYCNGTYNPHIGGIIGYCYSYENSCILENNVNMAGVTFSGNISDYALFLGGVAGYLDSSSSYESLVKNCANYGPVTHKGTSGTPFIGGIIGYSSGTSKNRIRIQNCFNHGALVNNNTRSSTQYVGGISGQVRYILIENCIALGEVTSKHSTNYIGSAVGYLQDSQVAHCYWDKDIGYGLYGNKSAFASISYSTSFDTTTFELSESVTAGNYTGTSLLFALNALADHYYLRDYSHWALNRDGGAVSFTINGKTQPSLTISTQVILLPSLAGTGALWFDGWYTDASCTAALDDFDFSSTSTRELYGKYAENSKSYTITFDSRGGTPTPEQVTAQYFSVVALPNNTSRDNCTVGFWEDDCGDVASWNFSVPAHDLTLHAVWSCTRLASAADLIDFSKVVNNGADYSGTTVFLDSDIDLSGSAFEPIGIDMDNSFIGSFDGQGHTISNLVINSYFYYAGLFGCSGGATIRNVVMDSTCSVALSYYSTHNPYIGGIIGYCYSTSKPCVLENIVNMASVTFDGTLDGGTLYIGGIVGHIHSSSSSYVSYVRNCANYGSVATTASGTSTYAYVGGIVGYISGPSPKYIFIQNSLNYGAVVFNGTVKHNLYAGGIAGWSGYTTIENSLSIGWISLIPTTKNAYIGSIVGYFYSTANITHCLWTSDVGYTEPSGAKTLAIINSSLTELNITAMNELNEYAENEGNSSTWSRWLMLHMNGGSINNLSYETLIVTQDKFPDPVKEGYTFLFWCTDADCNGQYIPGAAGTSSTVTDLYAHWTINNYTVTFDFSNGTVQSAVFPFNSTVQYPTAIGEREGYDFCGWDRNVTLMPAENITIRAVWNVSNPSEYVEIVFTNVDLSEEDVKEIIQGYTDEEFTIEKFEVDKNTGEIIVVIKFADEEKASEFIRIVDENKRTGTNYIKSVVSASDYKNSFSSIIYPTLISFFLFNLLMHF